MNEINYSVVIPVYNEEEVINECYSRINYVMNSTGESYEIIFVNDGSKDKTFDLLSKICENDKKIKLIDFSRNFGHQSAITAGMNFSSGKAVIVIDADLQDPPEVILDMIKKWKEGYKVVYGKRLKREGESIFKRATAKIFYRLLRKLTEFDIPVDAGDFRLIDRCVCDALNKMDEKNRYVRGIISWLGFKTTSVEFVREKRFAGKTKYPLKKMIKFASDAVVSFSYKPLRITSYLGLLLSGFSFLYLICAIFFKLFNVIDTVPVWMSIVAISLFFNGIVLLVLGIMGEYVGRIYDEVKARPLYVVNEFVNFNGKDNFLDEN